MAHPTHTLSKCEDTLRLVLLNICLYRDGERTEANFQKMLKEITYDCQYPKRMVAADWLQSHGFTEM